VSVVQPPLLAEQCPVLVLQVVPAPQVTPPAEPHPGTHCPDALQIVAGAEHWLSVVHPPP
jgi:hypothetical protein